MFGQTGPDTLPLKSWLANGVLALAVIQLGLALRIYGKLPRVGPRQLQPAVAPARSALLQVIGSCRDLGSNRAATRLPAVAAIDPDESSTEPPFNLLLEEDEVRAVATALNLLIADERHEPPIRPLAREVLANLESPGDEAGIVSAPLTPQQMKITHTAVKVAFDDTRREQAHERDVLRRILDKLPDEHTMRAIELD